MVSQERQPTVDKIIGIYGAGGHGRGVMEVLKEQVLEVKGGDNTKLVFVETHPTKELVNGVELISEKDFFSLESNEKYFNVAIADPNARQQIADRCISQGAKSLEVRSNQAKIFDLNTIGEGAIFSPFSVVTVNTKIGRFFHGNIHSCIEHDSVIGDFVTFSPGSHCNGNVNIGNKVFVGAGAYLINGSSEKALSIGEGAIIGMGSVVIHDVEPFTTVAGVPAKEIKSKNSDPIR
jgi:sugar O-acyltransferase (sialic acid O-acetyltransferase NeuD family)